MNEQVLESFIQSCDDMKIAIEGVTDVIKTIGTKIKEFFTKLKNWIKNTFGLLIGKSYYSKAAYDMICADWKSFQGTYIELLNIAKQDAESMYNAIRSEDTSYKYESPVIPFLEKHPELIKPVEHEKLLEEKLSKIKTNESQEYKDITEYDDAARLETDLLKSAEELAHQFVKICFRYSDASIISWNRQIMTKIDQIRNLITRVDNALCYMANVYAKCVLKYAIVKKGSAYNSKKADRVNIMIDHYDDRKTIYRKGEY